MVIKIQFSPTGKCKIDTVMSHISLLNISLMVSALKEGVWKRSGRAVGSSYHYVFSGFSLLVEERMIKFEFRPVLPAGLPSPFREDPHTQHFDREADL